MKKGYAITDDHGNTRESIAATELLSNSLILNMVFDNLKFNGQHLLSKSRNILWRPSDTPTGIHCIQLKLASGYRYIISEGGEVDVGVAQFLKWSIRIVAAIVFSWARSYFGRGNLWGWSKQTTRKHGNAEFLSRSKKISPSGSPWNGARNSFAWSSSSIKSSVDVGSKRG